MAGIKIQISNSDRVRFYNLQPQYGNLEIAHASRIIRRELIDKLSDEQKEARGISKNAMGVYIVSADKAEDKTDMTLTEDSLAVFKNWILRLSEEKKVYYLDEETFSMIMETGNN